MPEPDGINNKYKSSPAEFNALMKAHRVKRAGIVKAAHIKLQY